MVDSVPRVNVLTTPQNSWDQVRFLSFTCNFLPKHFSYDNFPSFLHQGFSLSALSIFWNRRLFVVGVCPVHHRVFSDIPGLYPLEAVAALLPSFGDHKVCRNITKCALGEYTDLHGFFWLGRITWCSHNIYSHLSAFSHLVSPLTLQCP